MSEDRFLVRDRRPGYLRVYNDLYDKFGALLGPYGLAVYMALCRYVNQDSECWPSHGLIARGTGMSRRQVIREIVKLEELQIIGIERSKHTSHVYFLLDTSHLQIEGRCDTQSQGRCDTQSQGGDRESHEQDLVNKLRDTRNNKRNKTGGVAATESAEDRRRKYLPAEFADIIHH